MIQYYLYYNGKMGEQMLVTTLVTGKLPFPVFSFLFTLLENTNGLIRAGRKYMKNLHLGLASRVWALLPDHHTPAQAVKAEKPTEWLAVHNTECCPP